jgi:uncharacterized protein
MNSALYVGSIAHRRHIPREHHFQYPFFMWFLALDQLHRLPELGRWFSPTFWALYRFRRNDYLGDPAISLADAVRGRMAELTGRRVEGEVCGLLNLSSLGLYFSPVNFYYGYDAHGQLSHFLAEVSNIPWNERHQYAHFLGDGAREPKHAKEFHVSPFNPIDQRYAWRIEEPGETLAISLNVEDHRGRIFEARLRLNRQPLTRRTVRHQLLRKPVLTAFIVAGIYYQACRLFLKKVPYIPHPKEVS